MKKNRIYINKIVLTLIFLTANISYADNFVLADWNLNLSNKNYKIVENSDFIRYEQVRSNQTFDKFFDKQIITIYKNKRDISPKEAGNMYFAQTLIGDNTNEKYILDNDKDNFRGIFCSKNLQRCEIIRYYNGYEGLIEIKYIHNNIWHFQNNIGSYLEFQRRIFSYPFYMMHRELINKETEIRI